MHAAQGSFVRHRLGVHVLGSEEVLLGIEEEDTGLQAGLDHSVALLQVEGHRLLADDVLACGRGVHGHPGVQVVGTGDGDSVQVGQAQQFAVVSEHVGYAAPPGEGPTLLPVMRGDGDHLDVGH